MVNAYKSGLVPKGNIQEPDYNGLTTEMAKNRVAAELCDYSGSVGSIYNVPESSSVVNQVSTSRRLARTAPGRTWPTRTGSASPRPPRTRPPRPSSSSGSPRAEEPGHLGRPGRARPA